MAESVGKKKMSLGTKSIIGVVLGILAGVVLLQIPNGWFKNDFLVNGLFTLVGNGYLTLLKMTIIPFVFVSLIMGLASATDIKQVGRIGSKTLSIYICTTFLATIVGIAGGMILQPGVGVQLDSIDFKPIESKNVNVSFVDVILKMLPSNIFGSMASGDMIHIVLFATFLGITISLVGKKAEPVKVLFESLNHVVFKLVDLVLQVTPYGVFALMARTVVNSGYNIILALAKYAICEIFLFILFAVFVYMTLLKVFAGINPLKFLKKYSKIIIIPFSTSSSNATIPYSIRFCRSIGVSNKVASFSIPLGATVNMDGSAIMQGMTAVFVAQLYNIPMTWEMIVTIVIASTLGTIGSPGMPGVVMVTLVTVLQSVGFPLDAVAIIVGIDRFTDMFKTVVNVFGDAVCTTVVSKSENEFDQEVFDGIKEPEEELAEIVM